MTPLFADGTMATPFEIDEFDVSVQFDGSKVFSPEELKSEKRTD